ncbi:MAG: helix-turn-helix transcriptional regulator [Phycisphaeraceae bacterium]|nr:helix-turn-helix transcriptional regulator [Phycisphaeraceae bacterium]
MEKIALLVLTRMNSLGLSQRGVARAAKVSEAALSRWLAGRNHIRSDSLERILNALGTNRFYIDWYARNRWDPFYVDQYVKRRLAGHNRARPNKRCPVCGMMWRPPRTRR